MQNGWLFIGIFVLVGLALPVAPIVLGHLIGPCKPNAIKTSTYECGMETVGDAWVQFKVQYYIFALTFLIFDVELVFLFPWAVAYSQLPLFGVLAGAFFIVILLVELLAAWRKGILEWA
jgi:NADH:ubiquinone oxidoreductase subunit 3 (subunit A)